MGVALPGPEQLHALRRDAAVRAIALSWRRLSTDPRAARAGSGAPTLLACSGGADSSALVLALAAALGRKAPSLLTVAHTVHDMRPRTEALADRDAARALAEQLGLGFVEADISVRTGRGNAEAIARRERYRALADLARAAGVHLIATAHHAGDQTESVLMGLLRGSGPRGLSGVAPSRNLIKGLRLIRPMLGVGRGDCERICRLAGWTWREDSTNRDTTRFRSALRHGPARDLAALRPGAERRIAASADILRDAAALLRDRATAVLALAQRAPGRITWARADLACERDAVVGEALRLAAAELRAGRGRDRLTLRVVMPAARAIRGSARQPREFQWRGISVLVTSNAVSVVERFSARDTHPA